MDGVFPKAGRAAPQDFRKSLTLGNHSEQPCNPSENPVWQGWSSCRREKGGSLQSSNIADVWREEGREGGRKGGRDYGK